MKQVKYVAVNRAEGPHNECKAVVFYVGEKPETDDKQHFNYAAYVQCKDGRQVVEAVSRQFSQWGDTAPEMGYDKCDFEVGWQGGQQYGGRFDMQKGGTDGHESFWASLKSRLEIYSLRRRPARFKDNHWKHFCEQMKEDGGDEFCGKILDECEIAA